MADMKSEGSRQNAVGTLQESIQGTRTGAARIAARATWTNRRVLARGVRRCTNLGVHREDRKLLFQPAALARWTSGFAVSVDDQLEFMTAFAANVFEDWHDGKYTYLILSNPNQAGIAWRKSTWSGAELPA